MKWSHKSKKLTKRDTQPDTTPDHQTRACGIMSEPKWLKDFALADQPENTEPFTANPPGAPPTVNSSGVPAAEAAQEDQESPGTSSGLGTAAGNEDQVREDPGRLAPPRPDGVGPPAPELTQLVAGVVPQRPWQFSPYSRDSSTWLAAAQRRHQHRRRSNALLGVASVDLSGPHDPTPMIGQKIGWKPGHYFVVLTIEPDTVTGYRSTSSQTDGTADPSTGAVGAGGDGPEPPAPPPDEIEEEGDTVLPARLSIKRQMQQQPQSVS